MSHFQLNNISVYSPYYDAIRAQGYDHIDLVRYVANQSAVIASFYGIRAVANATILLDILREEGKNDYEKT
jgi:hypothetical protein